jgi:hypothetical protein
MGFETAAQVANIPALQPYLTTFGDLANPARTCPSALV